MLATATATVPLWVAILLAIASPVVAAIAVAVGLWQQTRLLRHERRRDDLRETRGVLDDAARALHLADHCRRAIIGDLDNPEKREALRLAGLALDEIKQRLAIRFGRKHVVTTTCADCADAMLDVFGATQFAGLFTLPERAKRLEAAGRDFEARWPRFIDAATSCAGVELPARE
jgi:hypothetical protein